jgi:hypothetical protein
VSIAPRRPLVLVLLALVAIVAYLPALRQPFIEDDYPNLALAAHFSEESHWSDLPSSAPFRLRATSEFLMAGLYLVFDVHAAPFYAAGILLHVLNTWLVFALGAWRRIGFGVSAWAALFFAAAEGHQEAVMWISAASELLLFFFGAGALLAWILFLQTSRYKWLLAAIAAFALALVSKESAPVLLALMLLPLLDYRDKWRWLLPFAALAVAAVCSVFFTADDSFRLRDGSFSLRAPFWITLPRSFAAEFWIWGWLAAAALAFWRKREMLWIGSLWTALALAPYSFLTYSTRIPSRQTYLASAGAALVVGAALYALAHKQRLLAPAAAAILVLENAGYLWTRKHSQYMKRAEPTEQLIALSRSTSRPIYVKCFPRPRIVAEQAVWLMTSRPPGELIWDGREASPTTPVFCYRER